MQAYLLIENPGVCPSEGFTLLGASTTRSSGTAGVIGQFGSGNKHGVAVCLRHRLSPVVFCGNLKLEFFTRPTPVADGISEVSFERVCVKYGGRDESGTNRSATEDLGFVLDYGAADWSSIDLALREFVSNALDRAYRQAEYDGSTEPGWKSVSVRIVEENQVRAKSGTTRVFVPLSAEVLEFHNNLGKWFLHFSEPHLLTEEILPKNNRNLSGRSVACIYRRGVLVREFCSDSTPSLFDYNLEMSLDEARKVDDWGVRQACAKALAQASKEHLKLFFSSLQAGDRHWEHRFDEYGLGVQWNEDSQKVEDRKLRWQEAFKESAGERAVLTGSDHLMVSAKGYRAVEAPESIRKVAQAYGVKTETSVLTDDDRAGRTILEPSADAMAALEFVWGLYARFEVATTVPRPSLKCFRQDAEEGKHVEDSFLREDTIYINADLAPEGSLVAGFHSLSDRLLVVVAKQVGIYLLGRSLYAESELVVKLGKAYLQVG